MQADILETQVLRIAGPSRHVCGVFPQALSYFESTLAAGLSPSSGCVQRGKPGILGEIIGSVPLRCACLLDHPNMQELNEFQTVVDCVLCVCFLFDLLVRGYLLWW